MGSQLAKKRSLCVLILCWVTVCSCLTVWMYHAVNTDTQVIGTVSSAPHVSRAASPNYTVRVGTKKAPKTVLLWTGFSSAYPTWGKPLGNAPFHNHLCDYDNCVTTTNRRYEDTADIVLFYPGKVDRWPTGRRLHQIYVLYCVESPNHSNFSEFNYRINMTATYRLDSDLPTPYFQIVPKANPLERYILKYPFAQRKKEALWVVSNCKASSKRQDYVEELSKYISVDIWGGCGKNKCPRNETGNCFLNFSKEYKYYLSFENSICKDYVTDKLFAPMAAAEIVTITLGGADYTKHAPRGSYINARDYRSPKQLAEYLHTVSANRTLFESYLQWKATHNVVGANRNKMWCDLCRTANEGTYQKQASDIVGWWNEDTCHNSLVPDMLSSITSTSRL